MNGLKTGSQCASAFALLALVSGCMQSRVEESRELHTKIQKDEAVVNPVISRQEILDLRGICHQVLTAPHVQDHAIDLVMATQPEDGHELSRKYIEPAVREIGDPLAPGWPSADLLRQFDRISVAELLRSRGASPEEIALLRFTYSDEWDNGTAPDSALCLLRDEAIARKGASFRIRGGNDRLPRALAQALGDRVHYRVTLKRIAQNNRGVTVTVQESGRHSQISGDYIICAIPFTVLRSIEVSPAFSTGKQQAIRGLSYNSVTRVYVQAPTRSWIAEGLSGFATTDLPIGTVWDCTEGQPGARGILECYTSGERARRLASLSEPERLRSVVENLQKVYAGVTREKSVSIAWDADPLVKGAFAWFKRDQMATLLPHIARREGRVFFAGEHTSPWFGWMQGALQSGNRAAHEVSEASS